MEGNRILVTGFPVETTKLDLLGFFQSERDSGGGDVETVDIICPGRAVIIFAETEGNSRMISVVRNRHH